MEGNILQIKNMLCPRCIKIVKEDLTQLGHVIKSIDLGRVVLQKEPDFDQISLIDTQLQKNGFELLFDKESKLVSKIKTELLNLLDNQKTVDKHEKLSEYLADATGYEYSYLSKLFSETEELTIEKYYIGLKIERVKELLSYNELTLEEIAVDLDYSSAQYLSFQFKQITGMTPTYFKSIKIKNRKSLDSL
jgi:AraC-like DNA-binding protein